MSSSSSSSQLNYPLLAIPAYYVFSVLPHMYAGAILSANGYKINNANPKASMSPSAIKGKVPDAVFGRYQRAENAMSNNHEQMPFFVAAVLGSLIAERAGAIGLGGIRAGSAVGGAEDLGIMTFVGQWFVVRTVYNLSYILTEQHELSFIRSLAWAVGSGLAGYQLYKAACVMG